VAPPSRSWQPSLLTALDDPLRVDLREVTFVVLDLETTGGPPAGGGIVEVGAVKVRGGEQLGELATLVEPAQRLPAFVSALTGLTPRMVDGAPPIGVVLPSLLEFLGDAVLVAHNAPYDAGFLKAACAESGYEWPAPVVLDTAALARRVLVADEVRDRRLATLAAHFHTTVRPTHRALDDARATVEVLHALIARLGSYGVHTLRDAVEFVRAVSPVQRRKRGLAEGLPHGPGVYLFRGADGKVLYVGTSGDVATRVRSYFTAAERRGRITEMLAAADRVEAVVCAHQLEAQVRELRLIAAHAPPYNRRSRNPERVWWLKLTAEPFPGCRWSGRSPGTGRAVPAWWAPTSRPGWGRSGPSSWPRQPPPGSTTRCRCGSAPCGCRSGAPPRPACWPSSGAARPRASTASRWRGTSWSRPDRCGRRSPATRVRWWRRCGSGSGRCPTPGGTRRRPPSGGGWRRCCGRACGSSGWPG
jgi:DNA polymerase III epsilon subunit family exonuclease